MTVKSTFDPVTGLLMTNVQELYQKRIQLRKDLAAIEQALKNHQVVLKQYMAKQGYKKVETGGLQRCR